MITDRPSPGRPESVRLSAGLVAFFAVMLVPALVAVTVVIGAWAVADEVYAAEAGGSDAPAVAEWKSTIVGICPIH